MIALQLGMTAFGAATYVLFLTCGESRLFASVMAAVAAFLPMHVVLT